MTGDLRTSIYNFPIHFARRAHEYISRNLKLVRSRVYNLFELVVSYKNRSAMDYFAGNDYLSKFSCKTYVQTFYSSVRGSEDEEGAQEFFLVCLHAFYKRYNSKWDKHSARILEFGGGCAISRLISAVLYSKEIIFAAYLENERREVELWRENKDGAHDWSPFFKYIVNELEGGEVSHCGWKEREQLLRRTMKAIIPCDITKEYPLGVQEETFEIISTHLCLECASKSYIEYKAAVKKLAGLLKLGGFMTMSVVERETYYTVGQDKWYCLYLTLSQVTEALEEAGFVVLEAKRDPAPQQQIQNPTLSDFKAWLFIAAQKVN